MMKLKDADKKVIKALADNDLNVSAAARSIFMCRNSVVYRTNVIFNKTGLWATNFYDLVELLKLIGGDGCEQG